jgi:hypothetical protein
VMRRQREAGRACWRVCGVEFLGRLGSSSCGFGFGFF